MWFLVLTTGWSDIRALRKKERSVNHSVFTVLLFGLLIGLVLAMVLPFGLFGRIGILVLAVAGIVLNNLGRLRPRTAVAMFVLLFLSAALFRVTGVYADDGGWWEAGGTSGDWVEEPRQLAGHTNGAWPRCHLPSVRIPCLGCTNPQTPPIPDVLLDNQPDTGNGEGKGTRGHIPGLARQQIRNGHSRIHIFAGSRNRWAANCHVHNANGRPLGSDRTAA